MPTLGTHIVQCEMSLCGNLIFFKLNKSVEFPFKILFRSKINPEISSFFPLNPVNVSVSTKLDHEMDRIVYNRQTKAMYCTNILYPVAVCDEKSLFDTLKEIP